MKRNVPKLGIDLLFGCVLLSLPASVVAEETPLVAAGARVRVSTGPEVEMRGFRITSTTTVGRPVASDEKSVTFELDGHAFRLAKPDLHVIGTVQAVDDQTLTLVPLNHDASPLVIPRAGMAKLEMSRGYRRQPLAGAATGAGFFGVLGFAWGGSLGGPVSIGDRLEVAAYLAAGGAAIGALVGRTVETDRWEDIPRARFRLSIAPVKGGVGLSAALRF